MAENILNRFENIYDEEPEIDTSVKVKVGIIGTGWIAEEHEVVSRTASQLHIQVHTRL